MIGMVVKFSESDSPAWPELAAGHTIFRLSDQSRMIQISGLDEGMSSGAPSVIIRLDIDDHRVVLAETSLKLFLTAADALRARFGDPRHVKDCAKMISAEINSVVMCDCP